MPSEDVRKTGNWDSLFDTYKVKIATLIYNTYNHSLSMTSVINIVLAYNVWKLIM